MNPTIDPKLFELVMNHMSEGLYVVNPDMTISSWNSGAGEITGYTARELKGKKCSENILRHIDRKGKELCINGCPLSKTLEDGKTRSADVFLHHKEGHRVPVRIKTVALRNPRGSIIGAVEFFHDRTTPDMTIMEMERLRNEVFTDPLTGIGNRRFAEIRLEQVLKQSPQHNLKPALAFLDIDRFKAFNDRYSHETGDRILKMVCKTVANILRRGDNITRWGGEEFLVIFRAITPEGLRAISERIRRFIESTWISHKREKLQATLSIGATLARPGDTSQSWVHRADTLMYQSKQAGRNRVTID